MGSFKERGSINLTIKIRDKTFYRTVNVIDPNYEADQKKLAELNAAEEAKKRLIDDLSVKLTEIENNFTSLENQIHAKKGKYDLSEVSLEDLNTFLRNARSSLAVEDTTGLKASIALAGDELKKQTTKLNNSPEIKQSFMDLIRNNLLLISSTLGAIITLFTFYELMKKKKEHISQKIMQVKVTFENKKPKKEDKKESKKEPQKEKPKK